MSRAVSAISQLAATLHKLLSLGHSIPHASQPLPRHSPSHGVSTSGGPGAELQQAAILHDNSPPRPTPSSAEYRIEDWLEETAMLK